MLPYPAEKPVTNRMYQYGWMRIMLIDHTKEFLPEKANDASAGEVAEKRQLLKVDVGELTYAIVPPDKISQAVYFASNSEWLYVVSGAGKIWDGSTRRVISLEPGVCVRIPPACVFQYRSDAAWLEFVLATMPSRNNEERYMAIEGAWEPSANLEGALNPMPAPGSVGLIEVHERRHTPTHAAPDGSMIWELGEEPAGGLAICELPQGRTSRPVRHRSVKELWHVLQGHGELGRRRTDGELQVVALRPGGSTFIAPEETFQFRTTGVGPLVILILTMPAWPGPNEAVVDVEGGTWP